MSEGKPVPIWFNEDDLRRVREAAALAGYKHLSKYIRDRALGRRDPQEAIDLQAERETQDRRLAELERMQRHCEALLALLTMLASRQASTGVLSEVRAAASQAADPQEWLAAGAPDLAALVRRLALLAD